MVLTVQFVYVLFNSLMNSRLLACALAITCAGSTSVSQGFAQQLDKASESPASNPVFVPKSPQERAAFNAAADQEEAKASALEKETRTTVLPTLVHPFESPVTHPDIEIVPVRVPMRDGVTLRGSVYRPKAEGRYPVIIESGPL